MILIGGTVALAFLATNIPSLIQYSFPEQQSSQVVEQDKPDAVVNSPAIDALNRLEVKGRAPKTGYERTQFGNGWAKVNGCSTRDIILYRDLEHPVLEGECSVIGGTLKDLYSGEVIQFSKERSAEVQIDHVVALSDAWQKGAQLLTIEQRKQLANDPLELLASSGKENQAKGDGDAATWLPKNKQFRCTYVARQIAVKVKYALWVTDSEKRTMNEVLQSCPSQALPLY